MRVTIHVADDIGKEVEDMASKKGVSVSSLYAVAIEAHIKELKRQKAIEGINNLIGNTHVDANIDEQLQEMRYSSDRSFE